MTEDETEDDEGPPEVEAADVGADMGDMEHAEDEDLTTEDDEDAEIEVAAEAVEITPVLEKPLRNDLPGRKTVNPAPKEYETFVKEYKTFVSNHCKVTYSDTKTIPISMLKDDLISRFFLAHQKEPIKIIKDIDWFNKTLEKEHQMQRISMSRYPKASSCYWEILRNNFSDTIVEMLRTEAWAFQQFLRSRRLLIKPWNSNDILSPPENLSDMNLMSYLAVTTNPKEAAHFLELSLRLQGLKLLKERAWHKRTAQ